MKFSKFLKRTNLLVICCLLTRFAFSQSTSTERVAAYQDFRNFFYSFSNGISRQLESQAVRSFTTGGDIIGYVNNANDIIVWQNGEKNNLGDATNTRFFITNTFLYYQRDLVLAVWEKGALTRLTYFLRDFKVNDELIAFRDQNIDMLRVYYKGKISDIEFTLTGANGEYKAGKNTVAYTNRTNHFKVFYDDHVYELDNFVPLAFETGMNITAFTAAASHVFQAFYNGKMVVLENLEPKSFKCGDELVAYISNDGYFKIYNAGKLIKVESFEPDWYTVLDGTVLFLFNNQLQVIQNNERFLLDEFAPANYLMNSNCVAWKDRQGRLHLFSNGKSEIVTTEITGEYKLNGELLTFRIADGSYRVYYQGKTY